MCFIYITYIYIHIYIYIYIIYIYILYISAGFSLLGDRGNPPTREKFAHSPCTWNNFFPHQRLILSPLKKNFHVINQQKLHF